MFCTREDKMDGEFALMLMLLTFLFLTVWVSVRRNLLDHFLGFGTQEMIWSCRGEQGWCCESSWLCALSDKDEWLGQTNIYLDTWKGNIQLLSVDWLSWCVPEEPFCIENPGCYLFTHIEVVATVLFTEVPRLRAGVEWAWWQSVLWLLLLLTVVLGWCQTGWEDEGCVITTGILLSHIAGWSKEVMVAVVDPGIISGARRTQVFVHCSMRKTLVEWCAGPWVCPYTWSWTTESETNQLDIYNCTRI